MAQETTANGIAKRTANDIEYPTTVDSSSKRPTFYKRNPHLSGKIALEEHVSTDIFNASFTHPFTKGANEVSYYQKAFVDDLIHRLANMEDRIKHMNTASVVIMAVSLAAPGIEGVFDPAEAAKTSRKVNDQMHKLYRTGPHADRFLTWGCVPMQDPQAAAKKLSVV